MKESLDIYTNSKDSEIPQWSSGKKTLITNSKEKNVLPEPTKDIDTSSNRGYNEWDEGMDTGGESTKVEENIREVEGKE